MKSSEYCYLSIKRTLHFSRIFLDSSSVFQEFQVPSDLEARDEQSGEEWVGGGEGGEDRR